MAEEAGILCPGCAGLFSASDGPTHAYIGASAGCWAVYGELLAWECAKFGYPNAHRLIVDSYAAQHPGVRSRRAIQSVAVHLIGLQVTLERGLDAARALSVIRRALTLGGFVWLEPPEMRGAVRVTDVLGATDLAEHARRVELWAASVWSAWAVHADAVRAWAER